MDLAKREAVYQKVKPYLWCGINRRTGECSIRSGVMGQIFSHYIEPSGPFTFSPTKPPPRYKGSSGPIGGYVPPSDFPNPDYEWGHPDFQTYLRGYELLDERRAERLRNAD